jgi:homeobox protein cut-like
MAKNVSTIVELWTKFDLESIKRDLDDKIIEIAKQLEEGDDSRKRLIEQTKDFRKNLSDEQRKLVAPILKLFQIEVDTSTKRTKLMEQVLLKLYKQLIDVPDPIPVLENAQRMQKKAERSQDLELENKKLRETLEEYNNEFAEVKNQEGFLL